MSASDSFTFFSNLVVTWSYDQPKQQLTVSATLNGKSIGQTVLSPGHKTGQLQGSDGGNTATVGLDGNFTSRVLEMTAHETDGNKNGTHNGNF